MRSNLSIQWKPYSWNGTACFGGLEWFFVGFIVFWFNYYYIYNYIKSRNIIKEMHILQMNQIPLYYHKIHFIIKKKVKFGEAIYVCGNIN